MSADVPPDPPILGTPEDLERIGELVFRNQIPPRELVANDHMNHVSPNSANWGNTDYRVRCPACNPLYRNGFNVLITYIDLEDVGNGLRSNLSAIVITGELIGIGMLVAPWAVVKLGWFGFIMLSILACATVYSSTCLGTCWLILDERMIESRFLPTTDPYSTIAFHTFGTIIRRISKTLINAALFGAATVYLMLTAEAAHRLFSSSHPEATFCTWLVVFSISMSSLMFVENPKDVRLVALSALLTALTASFLVLMQILLDIRNQEGIEQEIEEQEFEWDTDQFFLSYGTILFCYGGAIAFPIVQNDMFKACRFSRCVIIIFTMMAFVFGAIIIASRVAYGMHIETNLIMSVGDSWFSYGAMGLIAAHLILGFMIIANPLSKELEKFLKTSQVETFSIPKFLVRMSILGSMIFLAQIVPNFSFLMSLVGSSIISLTTFVLPSLFYLKLCATQYPEWPDRSLTWKAKLYFYFIITLGLMCSIMSIFTAVCSILNISTYLPSCFWSFIFPSKASIA